ncbi:N-acetylmuramoyl-L-alanine amidase [Bacillus sp. T33-2]|uniref:N-acetylmuramoyl-L-alanine amidase n=1 Tax=Bacillus sp. T33-2 TaxID=2054168 RepID=UPI000C78355D|nr:N-acetylmuramoyl-L-alanine amidase [Bacillus sp. T33-2]PLR91229.1 N-acetylmuramoyl-L-alanine amidase [Bacillus sp. T33-2]
MRRKALLLLCILLTGYVCLTQEVVANAFERIYSGNFDTDSSYYFIHYNGEEQKIPVNENTTLTLSGWTDESKSTVKGTIDVHTDSSKQTEDVTMLVANELTQITLTNNESIHYRLSVSDSYKVEVVKPLELHDRITVVSENKNGTSIEKTETFDEYGTVIEDQGFSYYSSDETDAKTEITKEKYDSLNAMAEVPEDGLNDIPHSDELTLLSTQEAAIKLSNVSPSVVYSTHVQDYSWLNNVLNGEISGTSGQSKRLEAIKIHLQGFPYSGGITYSTHVQDYGWLNNAANGEMSGTSGQSKRLEAIKMQLTGDMANHYDVYYRVHIESYGWLDWAKNGMKAGSEGLAKRLEAIQIVVVQKGTNAPGSVAKPFVTPSVFYSTHVQDYAWLDLVADGAMSGTTMQAKRLEAIRISLQGSPYSGGITYSTHVQDYGWLNNVADGEISGTSGQSKRMEAIIINLTGDMANRYDVYYRVHIESYGWLGWAKNGMKAGSEGLSKRLEAIEIKLVPKGEGESVSETGAFKQVVKQPTKVFLDPGHGGSDPGAVAGGYREADINLAVAKKAQALLEARGFMVYMSRHSNTTVALLDRPQMANNLKADVFVSIHTNSTGSGTTTANGIESFYYEYNPNYPSRINQIMHNNPERIAKSVSLANIINQKMVAYTGANDRGTDGDSFAVIREAAMPATLLELGFINNSNERQNLVTDSYQNILAQAIADGIEMYFNIY